MSASKPVTSTNTQGTCERCARAVTGLGVTTPDRKVYHGICWEREQSEKGGRLQLREHLEGQKCLSL